MNVALNVPLFCATTQASMDILFQQIINGLVLGSLYALVALGYTMVYGVLGLINFAHGEILMIGALVAYSVLALLQSFGIPIPGWALLLCAVLCAIPVCMLVACTLERLAYRPLRNAPRLAPLISAIGASIILQTLAMVIWGRNYLIFPNTIQNNPIALFTITTQGMEQTVTATPMQLLVMGTACILMVLLGLMVKFTRLGKAMRATAQSAQLASLVGINPNTIIVLTFAIGAALAAVAGVLMAANYSVAHFYMGFLPGLKAFTAAVLGGIGNIYGAMLGGLLLGLVESLGAGYLGQISGGFLGSHYQDIVAFTVLILVLTLKPNGLLGERNSDRA